MATTEPATTIRRAADQLRTVAPDITGPLARLADPVADWLDTEADRLTTTVHPEWQDTAAPHAVAVARAVLGTSDGA